MENPYIAVVESIWCYYYVVLDLAGNGTYFDRTNNCWCDTPGEQLTFSSLYILYNFTTKHFPASCYVISNWYKTSSNNKLKG